MRARLPGAEGHDGVVLVDALVAIVVLSLVGIGLMRIHSESAFWYHERRARESELQVAERLLVAHTMLDSRDLDLRLGSREVGDYGITVLRPLRGLYRISVSRRSTPDLPELETLIFLSSDVGNGKADVESRP
jgi:hypothetical protein